MRVGGKRSIIVPPQGISAAEWEKFLGSELAVERGKRPMKDLLDMVATMEIHISK